MWPTYRPGPRGGKKIDMRDLFGDEIPDVDPPVHNGGRRAYPRPAPEGSGPDMARCRTCKHIARPAYHNKRYIKCGLMRDHWSHGPGTDIRLKDKACAKWAAG